MESMTASEDSKKNAKVTDTKVKRCQLPLPGDGQMVDVGGALTLPGVRKIRCDEAAHQSYRPFGAISFGAA